MQLFQQHWEKIKDKKFSQLTLAGSHDSCSAGVQYDSVIVSNSTLLKKINQVPQGFRVLGTYRLCNDFAKSQNLTITEQLNLGVRCFDIRICRYNNIIYTNHTFLSYPAHDVYNEIGQYLINNPKEMVDLYIKWSDTAQDDLSNVTVEGLLDSSLKTLLVPNGTELTIEEYVHINKRVFVYLEGNGNPCIWNDMSIFCDGYLDTNNPGEKIGYLMNELKMKPPNWLYRFGYTLTPQNTDIEQNIKKCFLCCLIKSSKVTLSSINNKLPPLTKELFEGYEKGIHCISRDFIEDNSLAEFCMSLLD